MVEGLPSTSSDMAPIGNGQLTPRQSSTQFTTLGCRLCGSYPDTLSPLQSPAQLARLPPLFTPLFPLPTELPAGTTRYTCRHWSERRRDLPEITQSKAELGEKQGVHCPASTPYCCHTAHIYRLSPKPTGVFLPFPPAPFIFKSNKPFRFFKGFS